MWNRFKVKNSRLAALPLWNVKNISSFHEFGYTGDLYICLAFPPFNINTLGFDVILKTGRVSQSGEDWGHTRTTRKIGLSPMPPPLFCSKNVDFVIFMQFLVILPKLSHQKSIPNGKSWRMMNVVCKKNVNHFFNIENSLLKEAPWMRL